MDGILSIEEGKCLFKEDQSICSSCNIAFNGYCGGNKINQTFCNERGWFIFNENSCVQCTEALMGNCGRN